MHLALDYYVPFIINKGNISIASNVSALCCLSLRLAFRRVALPLNAIENLTLGLRFVARRQEAMSVQQSTSQPQIPNPKPNYPIGVPGKFDPDGNVQPYPGNTIVSHLLHSSDLYTSLLGLYDKLEASPLAHLFALLPPSSWHMTVFEGVTDKVREPEFWPSDLSMDIPLEECTAHFAKKLKEFDLQEGGAPPYRLTIKGFDPLKAGIGVRIELQTPEENRQFRELRDRLSETLKIRFPCHDTYGLHISIAYFLRYLTEEQSAELTTLLVEHLEGVPKEFELGAPEFCRFKDMRAFERLFYLKEQK